MSYHANGNQTVGPSKTDHEFNFLDIYTLSDCVYIVSHIIVVILILLLLLLLLL